MSAISDDRINYLAHQIQETLTQQERGSYPDKDAALKDIKHSLISVLKTDEATNDKVRQKIANLKRGVQEGSPEWDVLYRKYMDEELEKKL